MLRVANIIEEGKLGGPQVRICAVAAQLKGEVETTVILPYENSDAFAKRCEDMGIPLIMLPITRITKDLQAAARYVLFSLFEIFLITRALKKQHFDIVHVSGGAWQFKGVIAAKLAGKKVLWHLNDTYMPSFIRRLFYFLSPMADGFICASKRTRSYYGHGLKKSHFIFDIPAPVDVLAFSPDNESVNSEQVDCWPGKVVIGTVANINPIKGMETLIHCAAALSKQFSNVQFLVVGPVFPAQRRYLAKLQKLAANIGVKNVEFVGAIDDIRAILKRFDIYLCSSIAESSPISVWEAMAMAKPVVSTDVGDVSLYLKDGVNGFIVDIYDSAAMAEQIACLIEDAILREEFGKAARKVAVQELDIVCCAERHLLAYKQTLGL